jgi:outer membrane lipoprotein carrier protein
VKKLISSLSFGFFALSPACAGGLDALQHFMSDVHSYRAGFEQTVIAKNGRTTQSSKGQLAFSRPGKFRWQIEKPYPQLMVGDGRVVWLYDPDLQQATRRKVDAALGSTPAALLAGNNVLDKVFVLKDIPARDGMDWVEAIPKNLDSGFSLIRLGFSGVQLRTMEMLDNFGQTTRVMFVSPDLNPALTAETFRFAPPAGVDVLGD